jgi:hypothetical protein
MSGLLEYALTGKPATLPAAVRVSPDEVVEFAATDDEQYPAPPADYEPTDEEIAAMLAAMGMKIEMAKGGHVSAIVGKFGSWAGGKFDTCVTKLRGKAGITNPEALCAWMKDRYKGTTHWRGKGK